MYLKKQHQHYQDFSFLLIYAIYLLRSSDLHSLLLFDSPRPQHTAMNRLSYPSPLSFVSCLCTQTDQELSLQLSVSKLHGSMWAALCSKTRKFQTAFHISFSSAQSWDVSLYFLLGSCLWSTSHFLLIQIGSSYKAFAAAHTHWQGAFVPSSMPCRMISTSFFLWPMNIFAQVMRKFFCSTVSFLISIRWQHSSTMPSDQQKSLYKMLLLIQLFLLISLFLHLLTSLIDKLHGPQSLISKPFLGKNTYSFPGFSTDFSSSALLLTVNRTWIYYQKW